MAQPSGRCGLLPFPREIRNDIYYHVFDSKYLVLWPIANSTDSTPPGKAADFALLRASKATKDEAMTLLYAQCQFRYFMDFTVGVHSPSPPLQVTNMMNDITLEFLGYPVTEEATQACMAIVKRYAGISIAREKMTIKLKPHNLTEMAEGYFGQAFFEALKKLRGFRTVIVEILLPDTYQKPGKRLQSMVRTKLEPSLGPAIEDEVKVGQQIQERHLRFFPQVYVLGSIEEEVARLEAEAAKLRISADEFRAAWKLRGQSRSDVILELSYHLSKDDLGLSRQSGGLTIEETSLGALDTMMVMYIYSLPRTTTQPQTDCGTS